MCPSPSVQGSARSTLSPGSRVTGVSSQTGTVFTVTGITAFTTPPCPSLAVTRTVVRPAATPLIVSVVPLSCAVATPVSSEPPPE